MLIWLSRDSRTAHAAVAVDDCCAVTRNGGEEREEGKELRDGSASPAHKATLNTRSMPS